MIEQRADTADLRADFNQVFDTLAWEIELAGARCIFLDTLIGGLMQDLPPAAQARLQEGLQAVDLLSQHLTGLSAFARHLGIDTEPGAGTPVSAALAQVTLGALADRLTTALGGAEEDSLDRQEAGDFDLF